MADALTTLGNVKTWLNVFPGDTSQDAILNLLITEVSAQITEACNRPFWLVSNGPTSAYLSGQGDEWLVLPYWPVRQPTGTVTLTNGSTTASALSLATGYTTTNLFVNQSVTGQGIPTGTQLTAVGSTTVTLSQAATLSGTGVPVTFGLAVSEDDTGAYEQAPGSFAAPTLLTQGGDYVLKVDQPDLTSSKSGMLLRLSGVWSQQYYRESIGLAVYGNTGMGNVLAVFNQGYLTIPPDLEMGAIRVISRLRAGRKFGQLVRSGSYEGASVSFAPDIAEAWGSLGGDAAALIARYRVNALGSS